MRTGRWAVVLAVAFSITIGVRTLVLWEKDAGIRDIAFTIVDSAVLPMPVEEAVDRLRNQGGHEALRMGDETFAVIALGQRSTEGYAVEVQAVREVNATTEVLYRERRPERSKFLARKLQYPFTVVMFPNPQNRPVVFLEAQR